MNSLEFIEKEIEFLEDMISMDMALIEDEYDLKEIAKKQQHLSHLHQIKNILEAWEIAKYKNVEISIINRSPNFEVYHLLFNRKITEEQQLTESDYETIKKALEVKDE